MLASSKSGTDIGSLLHGYQLCAATEGKSPNYISLVNTSVKLFAHFLEEGGFSTDVTKIEAQHIKGFILQLQSANRFTAHPFAKPQDNGLSGHTINAYMRSLRAFWSWLEVERIIWRNPFSRLKIPKAPKKVIPTFSEEQIQTLLTQADTSSP